MLTPKQIHDLRRCIEQRITGNDRAGHSTDRLIRVSFPEVLDEVERLRQAIWDMMTITGWDTDGAADASVLVSDIAAAGMEHFKMVAAAYDECLAEVQ